MRLNVIPKSLAGTTVVVHAVVALGCGAYLIEILITTVSVLSFKANNGKVQVGVITIYLVEGDFTYRIAIVARISGTIALRFYVFK